MEAAVAVAVTAAVIVPVIVGPVRDPERTFDDSDRTTHARAHGTADHATYRASDAMALVSALLRSTHDTLSTRELRQGEPGQSKDQ